MPSLKRKSIEKKRVALFHPWIKSRGGAERIVLELLKKSNHKIDVYTWVYSPEKTFEDFNRYNIKVIGHSLNKITSRFKILRGGVASLLAINKKIPLENYDCFLISTSGVGEFINFRNYKPNKTLAYVHTPLREANKKIVQWNLENKYKNILSKSFYLLSVWIYRILEKKSWKKLDFVIFNSKLSKSRAVESGILGNKKNKIIYPPIDSLNTKNKPNRNKKEFIYFSRLNPPKRQDVVIEAWSNFVKKHEDYKLIIAGIIEDKKYYRKLIKLANRTKNVEVITNLKDKKISSIINSSVAGIFLGYQEDFGMVPLEIVNSGRPLIAVDEGGYVELLKNHALFHKVKEGHSREKMINNLSLELEKFIKKDKVENPKKVTVKDLVEEIDEVLSCS